MEIETCYHQLIEKIETSQVFLKESMKKYTSFKIGGEADILVKANTIEDVKQIQKVAKENNVPMYILGNGSNVLVKDKGIRGIVVVMNMTQYTIQKQQNSVIVTARSWS